MFHGIPCFVRFHILLCFFFPCYPACTCHFQLFSSNFLFQASFLFTATMFFPGFRELFHAPLHSCSVPEASYTVNVNKPSLDKIISRMIIPDCFFPARCMAANSQTV